MSAATRRTKPAAPRKSPAKPPTAGPAEPLENLLGQGLAAAQRGRFAEAARLLRRVVERGADEPELADRARQLLAVAEQRLAAEPSSDSETDPYLHAVVEKNRGRFAEALAICRRGGRHRRDGRMAYLAASILALTGELEESAELLATAIAIDGRHRVQALHDSDFAAVRRRKEFADLLRRD